MKQLDERQLIDLWGERIEAAQIKTQLAMERIASALEKIEKLCGPYPGEPDTVEPDTEVTLEPDASPRIDFDLREWRKRMDITQAEAATWLGLTLRTYVERERFRKVKRECALACMWLEKSAE